MLTMGERQHIPLQCKWIRIRENSVAIKIYDLICSRGHLFEGWFSSEDDLKQQQAKGLLVCPMCGDLEIRRIPNTTRISTQGERCRQSEADEALVERARSLAKLMAAVRDVAASAEDVGDRFVDEARNIEAGLSNRRMIKGTCTVGEAEELLDEGIVVLPVPKTDAKTLN